MNSSKSKNTNQTEKWKLGTWNVRTMFQKGKVANIVQEMNRLNIHILGVSEARWTESGNIEMGKSRIIYSGGKKHENGVALILTGPFKNLVQGYWPISDRTLVVKLSTKPFNMTIIQVYAPTIDHDMEEINRFYEELDMAKDQCKSQEMIYVMGDFNAKVGQGVKDEVVGGYGLGKRNIRGEKFVNWCKENNQVIVNTLFKQHARRIWTWKSPDGKTKNQIDYITVNERFKNAIMNAKTYPGADCGSDHNPVVCEIRLKLKIQMEKNKKYEKWDWKTVKTNLEVQKKYQEEVKRKYQTKSTEQKTNIEEEWKVIKSSVLDGVAKTVPQKDDDIGKKEWMTKEILQMMDIRRKNKNTVNYEGINKEIKKRCNEAKQNWADQKCKKVEELLTRNPEKAYTFINELNGRKYKKSSGCIKDKQGNIILDKKGKLERWSQYIEELYRDEERREYPEVIDELDGPPILKEEIKYAVGKMREGKATGPDQISKEMVEMLDEFGIEILTSLANKIYDSGYIPEDFKKSVFITLPKKSNTFLCEEHRTISLMSHIMKIVLKVILERIRGRIKEGIGNKQCGFVRGKGTRNAIFMIRTMIERYIDMNKDVYICFIDFAKAFDTVNHNKLIELMKKVGIDGKDLRLITNLYWEQTAAVRIEGDISEYRLIKKGVRQGCILSPDLFNLYSEQIFKEIEQTAGLKIGGNIVNNIRYADDTALLCESREELQSLVNTVVDKCEQWDLKINTDKTMFMKISRKNADEQEIIKIRDKIIQKVSEYNYLGSVVSQEGKNEKDIRKRIAIAKNSFKNVKGILTNRNISLTTKKRLIKTYLWSVLMYGCECWTLSKKTIKTLEAAEMWFYRKTLKINWTMKKSNEYVLGKMCIGRQLIGNIRKQQMNFLGHIIRDLGLEWDLCSGKIEGKRIRGRKRTTFLDEMMKLTGKTNLAELRQEAADREGWKSLTANVCSRQGT